MKELEDKIKYYKEEASNAFDNSKFYLNQKEPVMANDEIIKYRIYKELKELAEILNHEKSTKQD